MTADHPTREERWSAQDVRDVSAWLIREADQRVKFFPQRRDGVDAYMRHLAALVAADPAPAQPDAALSDGERAELRKARMVPYEDGKGGWLFRDATLDEMFAAAARILAARAAQPVPAPRVCSQCGERMSAMVKVGTSDGWCTVCLDEAAEVVEQPVPAPEVSRHERRDDGQGDYCSECGPWVGWPCDYTAPEVSRGVAEVKAEALREAADDCDRQDVLGNTLWGDISTEDAAEFMAHPLGDELGRLDTFETRPLVSRWLRDRADRLVRDALGGERGDGA